MSGSPLVWMGSTTAGTSNLIGGRVELELEVCASKGKLQALSSSAQLEAKARARRTRTLWTLMLTSLSQVSLEFPSLIARGQKRLRNMGWPASGLREEAPAHQG